MKTPFISMILLAILLFFSAGCGKEGSLCGPRSVWQEDIDDNYISESLDPLTGNRTVIYEDLSTPENICTDEHTSARFVLYSFKDFDDRPEGMTMNAKAYWGLFEKAVEITWNPSLVVYEGRITDIGLQQAFGTNPGWIGLQISFTFPTQGSLESDTTLINNFVHAMAVEYNYYEDIVPAE